MQVTIKVFGKLRHYMPASKNAANYFLNFEPGETLKQLLKKLPLPKDSSYLVIHNDKKIDATQFSSILIIENDNIILLTPVKGG